MNKKTIYIIVAVLVVIIVVAAAAAYELMNTGGGGGTTPTPSPAPTVVGATTLQFNVNETTNGALVTYKFSAKNVNTTNLVLRLDIPGGSAGNYSYILDEHAQTAFLSVNNGVTWTADNFAIDWASWSAAFGGYVNDLVKWNGSDLTYSTTGSNGASIVIYSICPNPTLPDSLFATS